MNEAMMQSSNTVAQMLRTHPKPSKLDAGKLAQAAQALDECAGTCTVCADACLSEQMVAELVRCIRLNQDCADVCAMTACVLLRSGAEPQGTVLRRLLETCAEICRACGEECARHAQMHEHCRICAQSCRDCEETCRQMLSSM